MSPATPERSARSYLAERLHEHYELFPDQLPAGTRDPAEHLASDRCFYTFEPEEAMVPIVAGIIGEGRLMYASLSPDLKRKLLGANAATLFNLKG
ncbi:MAG TPA: hypothetical protein VGW35_02035 [Methylomirabilota bacterium]|nr:hypothetical protein [Methylomirabilota bacterium]